MLSIFNIPEADVVSKNLGWRYDFNYMQTIQKISEKTCGEQISLESVDAIIGAILSQNKEKPECFACGSTILYSDKEIVE